jgi:hypothetical protein
MMFYRSPLGNRKLSIYYGLVIGLLTINLVVFASLVSPVYGQSSVIILSPPEGLSAITIEGSSFQHNSAITVYWDDQSIPTLPLDVFTDEQGSFTCIISALNQTSVGDHEVKAEDAVGNVAVATFTVIDVTGPPGETGLPGTSGDGVSPGYLAGWLLLAAAIGGMMGILMGRSRQDELEATEIAEATLLGIGLLE